MAFATREQFVIRVTEKQAVILTNLGQSGATHVDTVTLDRMLTSATNVCQPYVKRRYVTGLLDTQAQDCWLADATIEIAAELMRQTFQADFISPSADNYRKMLRDLAAGKLELGIQATPPATQSAIASGSVVDRPSTSGGFA